MLKRRGKVSDAREFDPPVLLTDVHDSSVFNSGDATMDEWLRRRALANQQTAASRTYVVCLSGSQRITGYFVLSMGQILAQDVLGSMRRTMPNAIPAVLHL